MTDHKKLERVLKATANRRRFNILAHLKKEKELTVGEISEHINLSFKSTSRHLSLLFAADLVEKTQRGSEMFYRLGDNLHPTVLEILRHV